MGAMKTKEVRANTEAYTAGLERTPTGLAISFPDFPGCVSAIEGMNIIDAHASAKEALALHIAGMVEDGEDIPRPSSIHSFGAEDFSDDLVCLIWVEVEVPAGPKPERINITMHPGLLSRIDRARRAEGRDRSDWLAEAARERLAHSSPSGSRSA
jgi:predicted RNase H-like HicB family nuclease